ncbi:HAD hydrolase family protein [Paracoccus sp. PS-1]|uniref:HAD family hydrolase n=1 Tax=unclassified Paracoccus (in: a-proteobacteria) TaxID=2688777 RepID=UPI00048C2D3B|nr:MULTISPECIES: HAD family hydrolase [unclassified Paracoccus (in: a-proteobacteria)]MDQ7260874.1 HAD hydrolase family protein [Paracoccus sp. PS1]
MSGGTGQGPWLLVSDVDDTLTGDRPALERLWTAVRRHPDRLRLALNSSRPAASVDATLAREFPADFAPDAIITGMGTEIRVAGAWLEDWSARFRQWPAEAVFALVSGMGFAPHPAEFLTPGKLSFAVPDAEARARVLEALAAADLPVRAVFSGQSDLDLLAPGAGKDAAARFLAERLGIPAERMVVAGDSGNDLALFDVGFRAIAVGNARRELIEAMPRGKSYRARAPHAAGVLEGLVALGILPG